VIIGPVVSAENWLIEIYVVVWCILSNISGFAGPIFAIFSPYESTLRADDGSVPIFQLEQLLFSNLSRDVAMEAK